MSAKTCEHCGQEVPPQSPGGLCPQCLYRTFFRESDTDSDPTVKHHESDADSSFAGPVATRQPNQISPSSETRYTPGTVISRRYRIVSFLGRGGMGDVYRADDLTLRDQVALKMLPPGLTEDPMRLEAMHNEVRQGRRVSHPNVCRIHDISSIEGHHFLTMEYIDGENLAELCRRIDRLPFEKALQLGHQLCAGLDAAHREGVLHCDLKPANLMVDGRGNLKITDFGLARLTNEKKTQRISGTPRYMAPEHLLEGIHSERTDIYSLGLILSEMFTGQQVHASLSMDQLRERHRSSSSDPPRPPISKHPLAAEADSIVGQCLARDPATRPANVATVQASLPGNVDPLERARASGELPEPELVAAAGGQGVLKRTSALALLALTGLSLWGLAFILPEVQLFDQLDPDIPPEDLALLAVKELEAQGHKDDSENPTAYGFARSDAPTNNTRSIIPSASPGGEGRPEVYFWYRTSPEPLYPITGIEHRPSEGDPPTAVPGMINLRLTPAGELSSFIVQSKDGPRRIHPKDEDAKDSSLDLEQPRPIDWQYWFEVFMRFAAILLAFYHFRGGRGDRSSATKITLFIAALVVIDLILGVRLALGLPKPHYFSHALYRVLGLAALAAMFYLAMEPLIRRLWPETLIAWSRLFTGRWRDPLVGQSLVVGAAAGTFGALLWQLTALRASKVDFHGHPFFQTSWRALSSTRSFIQEVLDAVSTSIFWCFVRCA